MNIQACIDALKLGAGACVKKPCLKEKTGVAIKGGVGVRMPPLWIPRDLEIKSPKFSPKFCAP